MPSRRRRGRAIPDLEIIRAGAIAREVLADPGECQVLATFRDRTFVACPRGIVCLGGAGLTHGPINVEVRCEGGWAKVGLMVEDEGVLDGETLAIEDKIRLETQAGATWTPPAMPAGDAGARAGGLAHLNPGATRARPDDGRSPLIVPSGSNAPHGLFARGATGPLADLQVALSPSMDKREMRPLLSRAATLLIGLGPGFMPSGDCLLAGVMLGLTATGRRRLRDALWQTLEPELGDLTTAPSAMTLSAAADGMTPVPVHLLLNSILDADTRAITHALHACAELPDTSGWDMMAGLALCLQSHTREAPPASTE
ncbi:MAG: DUF2877 domain-containing protein [Hyphomicrobiaceae bacterium]